MFQILPKGLQIAGFFVTTSSWEGRAINVPDSKILNPNSITCTLVQQLHCQALAGERMYKALESPFYFWKMLKPSH